VLDGGIASVGASDPHEQTQARDEQQHEEQRDQPRQLLLQVVEALLTRALRVVERVLLREDRGVRVVRCAGEGRTTGIASLRGPGR
jgi:hypothetical protein